MAKNLPWFKFNPIDFMDDEAVKAMSYEARGLYITMLCHCWTQDSMPAEEAKMASIFNLSKHKFKALWPQCSEKFFEENGRLFNFRICREKKSSEKDFQQKSDSGKLGAEKRWHTQDGANGTANGKTMQDKDSDKDKEKKKINKETDKSVRVVFDYYLQIFEKLELKYKFTKPRQNWIKQGINAGYSVDDLKQSIDAMAADTWSERRKNGNDCIEYAVKVTSKSDMPGKWINKTQSGGTSTRKRPQKEWDDSDIFDEEQFVWIKK